MFDSVATSTHYDDMAPRLPTLDRIVHEMDALSAATEMAEGRGDAEEARRLCRTYLWRMEPETTEEAVTMAALQRILKRPVTAEVSDLVPAPWEDHVADLAAVAWTAWAASDRLKAEAVLFTLKSKRRQDQGVFTAEGGALHLLTLYFWTDATAALIQEDNPGARRFFRRALDLGSQFGTASHPMISWAYAASMARC